MKNVTLIFPSILELVDFTMKMKSRSFEVNRSRLSVTGQFSEEDIETARRSFKAAVVQTKGRS
jgi:hypothetical protein